MTQWIHGWKRNGWRTADKKPVKNEDLWRRLDAAAARHEVDWRWVRGHAGHAMNERADELAREGMAPFLPGKKGRRGRGGRRKSGQKSLGASAASISFSASFPSWKVTIEFG